MSSTSLFILIWITGAMLSNALLDAMVIIRFAPTRPSKYIVLMTIRHVYVFDIGRPYKAFNIYLSLILSWFGVAIGLLGVVGMYYYKKHFWDGEEEGGAK